MFLKSLLLVMILSGAVLNISGCNENTPRENSESEKKIYSDVPEKYHSILKIFESDQPARIISISPSTTELLFEYGVGDRIAGATKPHNYPPEAENLPSIGDMSLDTERIISLNPDILIGEGNLFAGMVENIKDLGIPVLLFDTRSKDDLMDNLKVLDHLFNMTSGQELIQSTQTILSGITRPNDPPTVAAVISSSPIILAAGDSYLVNLIEISGGKSVTSDTPGDYVTYSREDLIIANPEIIIYTFEGTGLDIQRDETLSGLTAIKNDRGIKIDSDVVLRPTLRSIREGTYLLQHAFFGK
ncbi:MAG: helical backbone metal receptor [bacterium]